MKSYFATIRDWRDGNRRRLREVAQAAASEMAELVQSATPVDTGALRSAWQPALNIPDETGEGGIAEAVIDGMELGDTFHYRNNKAYALRVEFGFVGPDALGRVYNQSGRFYVTDTVSRWPDVVRSVTLRYDGK